MTPRQLTARIAQRTSQVVAVTALALGLAAAVLAPEAAVGIVGRPTSTGAYSFGVSANPYNEVREAREMNNAATISRTVS